jgi:redox-sensitive bicupin YhaK (pirin superfamily)
MSWQPAKDADTATPGSCPPVEIEIIPRSRDLGGFEVRRVLPSSRRRMIGPFIFFDQMGPATLTAGTGIDVRPHPHIGLSTVTWLFEGEIMHRDSLGSEQPIRPGEVNWMTAGSGIAHSERTPAALRPDGPRLYGLQTWLALPQPHEETAPAFEHFKADKMPRIEGDGVAMTLIAGSGWGKRSPCSPRRSTPTFASTRARLWHCRPSMKSAACTCSAERSRSMGKVSSREQCSCCGPVMPSTFVRRTRRM